MTGRVDVHAHFLTERYADACRAAGHGQPDGMPAIPDFTPAPVVAQLAAALDTVPVLDAVRDNALALFPRLRTARSARPAAW